MRKLFQQVQEVQEQLKAKLAELYVQVKNGELTVEERARLVEAIETIKAKIERGTERRTRVQVPGNHGAAT